MESSARDISQMPSNNFLFQFLNKIQRQRFPRLNVFVFFNPIDENVV
jgi:hypothetical protein